MKKIFIVLSLSVIFTFLILNNTKASAYNFADEHGTTMAYTTLILYDDFEFTGSWGDNSSNTFYFEYKAHELSLQDLMIFWHWGGVIPYFMELYTPYTTFEYLDSRGIEPNGDIGWTTDDSWLYLIIKKDFFSDPEFILPEMGDFAEIIRVDTWVVVEASEDYQNGYNAGYYNGYQEGYINGHNDGFTLGWDESEEYFNEQLPELLEEEYQRGYNTGLQVSQGEAYEQGYLKGANESFIGTMDKWLVPAIIIIMLLGGYFAIARKKRDGDI